MTTTYTKQETANIVTEWSGQRSTWDGDTLTCDWGQWSPKQIDQAIEWHEAN